MKRRAFTLVELLVVILIISLLLTILFPVLRSSKEKAKTIQCQSNVRQLTMAMNMYEMDNRTFPPAFLPDFGISSKHALGSVLTDNRGWWWLNFIEGYLTNVKKRVSVFKCPLKKVSDYKLKRNLLCGNYGVNLSICKYEKGFRNMPEFVGKPLSISSLKSPSKTLLLLDSGYATISYWKATEDPTLKLENTLEDCTYVPGLSVNKNKKIWPGFETDAIEGRHYRKKVNAGFPDGHIEKMSAKKLLVEKTGDVYKNSPLWVP